MVLVQARAQGNPFFAEEMIATLREAGGLRQQPQGDWQLSAATLTALRQANCLVKQAGDWILAPAAPLETAKDSELNNLCNGYGPVIPLG